MAGARGRLQAGGWAAGDPEWARAEYWAPLLRTTERGWHGWCNGTESYIVTARIFARRAGYSVPGLQSLLALP
jgi:hypothetical protein